jgi:glycerophosphoryl diester phosphodiesterase
MMRRIGHRGAKGHAPENTVASFEKAIALGCDEIETDVWLLGDGELAIAHDRPASAAGLLRPEEVLDLCRGRVTLNIELKSAGTDAHARATGERVARLVAERAGSDAYVSSFWWSALDGARAAAPNVRRAFIYSAAPDTEALIESARSLGLWALHPNHRYVTPELVRAAHAASLQVNVWTVNEPADIAALVALGVDGIASDFPDRVPKGHL